MYRLSVHLHLQETGKHDITRRIVVLLALAWFPVIGLAAVEGNLINTSLDVPLLHDVKFYTRYLVSLPMLLLAGAVVDPLVAATIVSFGESGVIDESNEGKFNEAVRNLNSRKESMVADVVIVGAILLIALGVITFTDQQSPYGAFSNWLSFSDNGETRLTHAGWWYLMVSSPILMIVLFRWVWRYLIWCEFLFRVSRIKLRLEPTHPDLAGGLGILKIGGFAFIMVFLSFGSMVSAALAQEILYTDSTLTQMQIVVLGYVIILLFVMKLPLFFFAAQLVKAKGLGRLVYGALGYRLSQAFDEKWGRSVIRESGGRLLEATDSSTVCDYADVYGAVRDMRIAPIGLRDYLVQAAILALPFLPLVLTEISLTEMLNRLIGALM
ncbi:MAG: hypothetical protein U9R74_00665 [Pseudomonadota bacterium]|nr:hypothetical protein [Pseudomonadota bacterium]